MAKKNKSGGCCSGSCSGGGGFKIESLVSVDSRGQMVLPKDLRDRAGIKAGDKLAVVTWALGDKSSCLLLIKEDTLESMAGPMANGK
jgi:AbrB family looped-hinge helix DNA binding protein